MVQVPPPQPKRKPTQRVGFLFASARLAHDLRVISTSVARWGSRVAAASGRRRQRASTAAVEKARIRCESIPKLFRAPQGGLCSHSTNGQPPKILISRSGADGSSSGRRVKKRRGRVFTKPKPQGARSMPSRMATADDYATVAGCVALAVRATAQNFNIAEWSRW